MIRRASFHSSLSLFALTVSAVAHAQSAPADDKQSSDVTVTAQRRQDTARAEEKAAANIVNIQAAETIAKYPDVNAAEALSRIPGVALSIDTGEGRFINIRGLDGNLNGSTFAGVQLLNTQPGGTYFNASGRAVEFDTVPVGSIDRIVVTKTGMPDHEAEGLGGSIELTPRTAIGATKPFAEVTLGGGIETLRPSALYRDEIVLGQGFGPKTASGKPKFSIVLTQFLYNDRRGFDDLEAGYVDGQPAVPDKVFDSLEYRRYNYFRKRFGYSGEFDFTPDDNNRFFLRANFAGYNESVQRYIFSPTGIGDNAVVDPTNRNGFVATDAGARRTFRDENESHHNFIAQVGGEHRFGEIKADWFAAYSEALYNKPYDYGATFSGPGGLTIRYDNTTNPDFPTLTQTGGPNFLDSANYRLSRITNSTENSVDREYSVAGNLALSLHLFDDDTLKFGFKIRRREKVRGLQNFTYTYRGATAPFANFAGDGPFTNFYGRYPIGTAPNPASYETFLFANLASFSTAPSAGDISRNNGAYFDDTENVTAGYIQYHFTTGRLGFLAGVRVENTDSTYRGLSNTGGVFTPVAPKRNYTNFFPTAQARFEFTPQLIARATYSTAIARPGFLQTIQNASVDVAGQSVSVGNPNLKPTYGNNFDLSIDFTPSPSSFFSIGVFDKEFRDYVVTGTVRGTYPGITGIAVINTFSNISGARARGIEVAGSVKFSSLPGWLAGFGIDANGAYVDSKAPIGNGAFRPGEVVPLPGTFKYTGNLALFYELGRVKVRGAAQYESSVLFGIGGSRATDVFQDKRFTVDLNATYDISRHVQLYTNVKNLTNEPLRFYEGSANRPIQREFYLATIEAGVKIKL